MISLANCGVLLLAHFFGSVSSFDLFVGLTMAPAYYQGLYSPREPSVLFVDRKKNKGDSEVTIEYEPMEIPDKFDASVMLPRGMQPRHVSFQSLL